MAILMTNATSSTPITEPGYWLGHYTRADTAFTHILPTKKLRMSPYHTMRDPAENKDLAPVTSFFVDPQANQEQAFFETLKMLKDKRDRMRLLSLTHDVTRYRGAGNAVFGCCWARPRMWEQYADAHKGVCLVFDSKALKAALRRHSSKMLLRNVTYTPTGISGSEASLIMDPRIFADSSREQAVTDYIVRQRRDLFFLKSEDWRTEYEFRALLAECEDEYALVDFGRSLRMVVLGEKFPEAQCDEARDVCKAAGVVLKRATWWHGKPIPTSV